MNAVLCPVCVGSGKYHDPTNARGLQGVCHGCMGRGWVLVPGAAPTPPLNPLLPPVGPVIRGPGIKDAADAAQAAKTARKRWAARRDDNAFKNELYWFLQDAARAIWGDR